MGRSALCERRHQHFGRNERSGACDCYTREPLANNSPDTPLVVLLTDGEPSAGITDGKQLRAHVSALADTDSFVVNALGFGQNLDFDLLKNFAADSNGNARRIYADSDAVEQLTGYFSEISTPLLSNVVVKYEPFDKVERLTTHEFETLFLGSELVVAGKVAADVDMLRATVEATSACGCKVAWQRRFNLTAAAQEPALINAEKAWAFLTVQELLVQARREEALPEGGSSKADCIDMALEYQFGNILFWILFCCLLIFHINIFLFFIV